MCACFFLLNLKHRNALNRIRPRKRAVAAAAWIFAGGFLLTGSTAGGRDGSQLPSLEHLLEYENRILQGAKDRAPPKIEERFGADPFRVLHLRDRNRYLVLLRNRSEILLADRSLSLLDRQPAPRSPTGWSLVHERFLFVGGERSSEVYLYEITTEKLRLRGKFRLDNGVSVRDLVYVPGLRTLFLLDDFDRQLHQWRFPAAWWKKERFDFERRSFPLGAGAIQIRYVDNHLVVNLLLEHSLWIIPLTRGAPEFSAASRITHDGPIWGFDARVWNGSLIIAAAGIEDRPLNRLGGEFGFIDSFLFLYRVPREKGAETYRWRPEYRRKTDRFTRVNLSALDLITPKALRFAVTSERALSLWVAAFGSGKIARFTIGPEKLRLAGTFSMPPGSTDLVVVPGPAKGSEPTLILTNSLFDRLYRFEKKTWIAALGIPADPPGVSRESRIGELLFFTTLMTPHNRSEGELSRFTCEACHYEGTIDGRVHYTGRDHVFATTKPLRGLANNLPLFSRAGDRSLASMVLTEFRVANQGRDDDFSVEVSQFPWLKEIPGMPEVLTPTDLREALLSFFVDFESRPNPLRARDRGLSAKALKGLELFRERCEYCHQASISTRVTESLPCEKWQEWLEVEEKDLVWGAPFYTKTGIEPYVHRARARVPSLRRIWQKYPYFTNGSSRTLRDLLTRFRYRDMTAWHHYEASSADGESHEVKTLTPAEISLLEELLRHF